LLFGIRKNIIISDMTLQTLRYFSIIAELENMSKAAELLHTTQSSLSKAIFSLEKELGVDLFDRKGKKLVLNDAGMRFLESCKIILKESDEVNKELSYLYSGKDNEVKICTAGLNREFYNCMAEFKKQYSNVEYVVDNLVENNLPDINYYDVIIYPNDRKFEKFKGFDFAEDRYLFVVNKDHELNKRASVPVSEMDGRDYVFLRINDDYAYSYRMCSALRIDMNSISFAESKMIHRNMIASGIGVGFVSSLDADSYRDDSRLRLIPLTDDRFSRHLKICFKREKHLSEMADAFKNYVVEYFNIK